jgi:hypothetical protein
MKRHAGEEARLRVAAIYIYPIKSTRGVALSSSPVERRGLAHDRRWALFGPDGKVLTARDFPKLLALEVRVVDHGIALSLDGNPALVIPYPGAATELAEVDVFDRPGTGRRSSPDIDSWFQTQLGTDCRLVFMGAGSHRETAVDGAGRHHPVSFADEYPLLLVSQASLDDLNARLSRPVGMRNFRPNIVVRGCDPYAEDGWKSLRIGDTSYRVTQQCQRCVFTTIDPDTHERNDAQEPLRTLSTYHRHPHGGVAFGVHLVPLHTGTICVEDEVVATA